MDGQQQVWPVGGLSGALTVGAVWAGVVVKVNDQLHLLGGLWGYLSADRLEEVGIQPGCLGVAQHLEGRGGNGEEL